MDGKVFKTIIAPDAGEKEVNSLTKFIFDLQRFATVTLTEVAATEDTTKYYTLDTKTGVQYATVEEALAAVDSGDTVKLGTAITADSTTTGEAEEAVTTYGSTNIIKSITIDLNGKIWDVGAGLIIDDSVKYVGKVAAEETRTVKITDSASTNGKISASGGKALNLKSAKSTVTIEDATINVEAIRTDDRSPVMVNAGELILNKDALVQYKRTTTAAPSGDSGDDRNESQFVIRVMSSDAKLTMNDGATITPDNSGIKEEPSTGDVWGVIGVDVRFGGTFDMNGGKIQSEFATGQNITDLNKGYICDSGVWVWQDATFNMKGGNIQSYNYYAVSTNGSNAGANYAGNAAMNITGKSSVKSTNAGAIYAPAIFGDVTIGDGSESDKDLVISGKNFAVEVRSGTLTVNSGSLEATNTTTYTTKNNGNGDTTSGAAISVAQHTTCQPITVTINGGTMTGAVGMSVANPENNKLGDTAEATGTDKGKPNNPGTGPAPEITINDGTFTGNYQDIVVKEGSGEEDEEGYVAPVKTASAINVSDSRARVNIAGGTFNGALTKVTLTNYTGENYSSSGNQDNGGAFDFKAGSSITFGNATYGTNTQTAGVLPNAKSDTTATEGTSTGVVYSVSNATYSFERNDSFVATVDGVGYKTLQAAITAAATGKKTVELITDITTAAQIGGTTETGTISLSSGDIELNLNGYSITSTVGTLFTVGTGAKFAIKDSQIANSTATTNAISSSVKTSDGLIKVSGGTFTMLSGRINTEYTAIGVSDGSATIKGEHSYITVDNSDITGTNVANAINVTGGALTIGQQNAKLGPTIVDKSSASGETDIASSAIYVGSISATVNVYGGSITMERTKGGSGYGINAASLESGAVNIDGSATISATANGSTYKAYGVYSGNNVSIIGGAVISGTNTSGTSYGVYAKNDATITGSTTNITGGTAALAGAKAPDIGVGVTFVSGTDSKTIADGYYYSVDSANSNVASFIAPALTSLTAASETEAATWQYTYGALSSNYIPGEANKGLTLVGGLFDGSKLDQAQIQITGSGTNQTVRILNLDAFDMAADGNFISIAAGSKDSYKFYDTEDTALGFKTAENYDSIAAFTKKDKDSIEFIYKGKGADNDGFTETDSKDILTYHTARTIEFGFNTSDSSIQFATGVSTADTGASGATIGTYAGYFNIDDKGKITIVNPSKLFADSQSKDGLTLALRDSDTAKYDLSVADSVAVSYLNSPQFKAVYNTTAEGTDTPSVEKYTYALAGGAVNQQGNAADGYMQGSNSETIIYRKAADSFSFVGSGDDTPYFQFDTSKDFKNWFSVTPATLTVVDGKPTAAGSVQINSALLNATTQVSGAALMLDKASAAHYNLTVGSGLVSSANPYIDHETVVTIAGGGTNNYLFRTDGMSSANGFVWADVNEEGKNPTLNTSAGDYLVYYDAANRVSLSGSLALAKNVLDTSTATTVKSVFSYTPDTATGGATFTILDDGAFATLEEGKNIYAQGNNITLAFKDDTTSGLHVLAENEDVVASPTLSSDLVYKGVGASVAGFENNGSGTFTWHQQYNTFTLDTVSNDMINGEYASFANNVSISGDTSNKTITIGEDAILTNSLKSGAVLQLASVSADSYSFALGTGVNQVNYVKGYWNPNTYEWGSEGSSKDNGFVLSTLKADSGYDKVTYYTEKKEVQFAVSDNDSVKFVEDNSSVQKGIKVDGTTVVLSKSIFDTQDPSDDAWSFTLKKDADGNPIGGYTAVSLSGFDSTSDMADGDKFTSSQFVNKAYTGQGALTKSGYALDSDGLGVSYYNLAKTFTLAGTAALNDSTVDSVVGGYFKLGDAKDITVGAAAFDTANLAQGQTISLASGNTKYTVMAVDGFDEITATNKFDSITISENGKVYTGIGAVGKNGFYHDDTLKTFTYYQKANNFTLGGDVLLATAAASGQAWDDDALNAAISITDGDVDSTVKTVTFKSMDAFDAKTLADGSVLSLEADSSKGYKLAVDISGKILADTDISSVDAVKTGSNGAYTYTFAGASYDGFLEGTATNSAATDGNSIAAGTFKYYEKADELGITSNIALDTTAVNANLASVESSGKKFININTTDHVVTFDAGAFTSAAITGLKAGDSIGVGSIDTVQYAVSIVGGEGASSLFTTAEYSDINYWTPVESAKAGNGTLGTFQFAGAKNTGFLGNNTDTPSLSTALTYTNAADKLIFVGTASIASAYASDAKRMVSAIEASEGNADVSFYINVFDTLNTTGTTVSIANPTGATTQYKLVRGNLSEAQNVLDADEFAKSEEANTYHFRSAGADAIGFTDNNNGMLTYYAKRDHDFTLGGTATLNTELADGETANGKFFTISERDASGNATISLKQDLLDTTTAAQGQTIILNAGDGYKLALDGIQSVGSGSDTSGNYKIDNRSLTAQTFTDIGAINAAGLYYDATLGGSLGGFTYYEKANSLTLAKSGTSTIAFATKDSAGTAWTNADLEGVFEFTKTTDSKTNVHTTVTIKDAKVFDTKTLNTGAKLAADTTASGQENFTLAIDIEGMALTDNDLNTANLAASTDGAYVYTFDGADKAGFYTVSTTEDAITTNDITYYAKSDILNIKSDIELDIDAITETPDLFNVDTTKHTITLKSGAFKADALAKAVAEGGAVFSVGTLNDDTSASAVHYKISLGDGLKAASLGTAIWGSIGTADSVTGLIPYKYTSAGYAANNFSLASDSYSMTLMAEAENVTFDSNLVFGSNVQNYITISDDNVVSISSGAFGTQTNDGASISLNTVSSAAGYTLNLDALKPAEGNTYSSVASFSADTDKNTGTYTTAGMSSVAAYYVEGSDSSTKATWHTAANSVHFITDGITFASDASAVADAIAVSGNNVTIGAAALANTAWYSGAKLSIDNSASVNGGTAKAYTFVFGDGVTSVSGTETKTAFNGKDKMFTTAGYKNPGYKIDTVGASDKNAVVTYYDTSKTVIFQGDIPFAADDTAKDNIFIDGTTVKLKEAALSLEGAASGQTLKMLTNGYTLAIGDLDSAGTVNETATIDSGTRTYTGEGASNAGFVENSGTLTYYKQYENFTLTSGDDVIPLSDTATASNFSITAGTGANSTIKTVTILDAAAINPTKDGQVLALDTLSAANGYRLAMISGETALTNAEVDAAASVDKTTGTYTAEGATKSGYTLSDNTALTYHRKADQFTFLLGNGTDTPGTLTWNSAFDAEGLGQLITFGTDGEIKTIRVNSQAVDTSALKGDGTETVYVTVASGNQNEYRLIRGSWGGEVADTVAGSFDAATKTIKSEGATFTSSNYSEGFKDDGAGNLTFYRAPDEVVLGGTATFNEMPSGDIVSNYFTVVQSNDTKTVTIQKNAIDLINNEDKEGVTITTPTGYSLAVSSDAAGVGKVNANNTFASYTYTSAGLTKDGTTEAVAGFVAGTGSSAGTATYHKVADVVQFDQNNCVTFSSTAKDNISVSEDKIVTVGEAALNSTQSDGYTLKLASGSAYTLNTAVNDEASTVGGLTYAGNYDSVATFSLDSDTSVYKYKAKGSDVNGYLVQTENQALVYRKARADEFTFTVASADGTAIKFADITDAAGMATLFSIGTATSAGVKTVTISDPTKLFAATDDQTNRASIKINSDSYKLAIGNSYTQVKTNNASFTASTGTYKFFGGDKDGYKVENGTIVYYDQAESFKFNTGSGYVAFNTAGTTTDLSTYFTFDDTNKKVTVLPAALNSTQTSGNKLSLTDAAVKAGYEIDSSSLIADGNEYQTAKFVASSVGGGTYTTAGASSTKGYVLVPTTTTVDGTETTTNVITYLDQATDIELTGTLKFKEDIKDLSSAITISGKAITINSDALATYQDNAASITVPTGYTLTIGSGLSTISGNPSPATFNTSSKVFTSSGVSTAGYKLSNNNRTATFYDTVDTVTFTGTAAFATNTNTVASNITVTKDSETGAKTVTVGKDALSSSFTEGAILGLNSTSAKTYTLAVAEGLDGGYYSTNKAFKAQGEADSDGNTTYTYMFGGSENGGFVNESGSDSFLTYHAKATQIGFKGNIGIDSTLLATPEKLAGYFTPTGTVVAVDTSIFTESANHDKEQFAVTDSGYTLSLKEGTTAAAGENDTATLVKGETSGYTYTSTGATTPGYKLSDSDKTLVYRAAIDTVTFDGDVVLDTTATGVAAIAVDAIDTATGVVTINKAALGTQTADDATLKIGTFTHGTTTLSAPTLQFNADDMPDAWAEAEAEFNADKTVYTTAGYSATGYQLANNEISYHKANRVGITFEGLADTATTTNVTFDKKTATFTLGNDALKDATNRVYGAKVTVTGDYKLVLANAADLKPDETEEDFDAMESGTTTATYHNTYTTGGYEVNAEDAKKIDFTAKVEKATLFTLNGVNATVEKSIVTEVKDGEYEVNIAKTNVADSATELSLVPGDGVTATLKLSEDLPTVPTSNTTNDFGEVDETAHTVNYVATTKTDDYWKVDDTNSNKYTLTKTADKEETLFALSGVANTTDITVDDKNVVTAAQANIAEGAKTVAVTGDYTLNLTDVVTEGKTERTYKFGDVADSKATYVETATTNAFWTKANDSKSYAFTDENIVDTDLFEISGVANTTDIAVDDKNVVTAAKANIADDAKEVAVTGEYTLNLTDVETEGKTEHSYKFSDVADNKATYVDTATTNAFWTKANDSKSYALTDENIVDTDLFEISGVANTTDIAVSEENVVTAAQANIAEDAKTVAVTGEYTLNLTDVETEGKTEHTYKFSDVADNKATYVDTATTNAFWTKANDSKSYAFTAEKVENTNLFELSGVANTTDVAVTEIKEDETVTGHKVVLTSANVATDAKEISLTGTNNVLELSGDDLPTAPVYGDTTKDFGDVDDTAHTVKYIATTEGKNYWLQDTSDKNKYTLTKADDKEETLFTLSGVKSKEGITVGEDGTVTITSASLIDQDTPVTIDADGYKLAIGDDLTPVTDVPASYADSVYSAKGKSAGYSVSSDGKTLSYSDTTVKSFTFENVADGADDSSFYYTSGTTVTVGQTAVKTDGTAITLKEASDGGSYNLKLGKGMSAPEELPATYADNVYTTAGMSAGYNLSENAQSISYSNSDTISFTFEGVADGAEASNFYLKDNVMTIGLAAVNTDGTTLTLKEASDGGEYTLKRGKGMTAATVYDAATYDAKSMTYNTEGATAGYILSENAKSISYNAEDTTTAFKFSGVAEGAEAANFYLKDNVMTIGLAAVNTDGTALTLTEVSDGGEYTLKRGKGMTAGYTYDKATYDADKMTYNTAGTVAGYALSEDAKSISYNAETTSTTFKFSGVAEGAETSNFYLKDNVMTIGLAAVNTDGTALTLTEVSDGGEYTLKRGKGMTAGYTYDKATYNASNMTYNTAGTVAGYALSDDAKSISYNAETTATTFKFSGVAEDAETSNFYLKGNVMTIGQAAVKTDGTALTLKSVSDEGDYTLKLGKGMTAATVYDTATYNAKSMTYNTKGATAGYALSSDAQSIAYNETATTTTFQFSGVADGAETSNFYLKDNVMTIGLAAVKTDGTALTLTNVSDGGEYTLKRGKGMTAAYTYDTATYDASKMTYNTKGTTAGYVLSDDAKSLSYNETATSDTFKFSGIADDVDESAFYVNAKNKTMTIGKAAVKLDGTAVKLTSAPDDEYVLKLGKGMSEATTETQTALDSGTFSVNEVTEGYALSEDKKAIAYDSTAETALEITGVASEPTISDKQVAVTTATFDDSTLTVTNNTGEYTFSVASGDYSGKIFTGSGNDDTITAQGDGISINGGAGNDSIKSSGLNVSINGGAGDDSILGGAGDEYFTGFNGNDYLHGGAGADTLNGGGGDDTLFGAAGDDSLNGGAGNDSMLGGNGNDQLLGGAGDDYLSGGAGNDVLRAGAGADTLWGGAGNDKLYGGDGEDTFIYRPNEGTDSIYNYTSGEDLLQIVDADGNEGTFTKSTFNSSKGTLALDIDGGGKVYFGGVTASDTFDINGKTYEISGSSLVEK